nr:MAG TPA: hypothetical protein [Caudoviricetes sp.]
MLENKKSVATTTSTTDNHSTFKYKVPHNLKKCK